MNRLNKIILFLVFCTIVLTISFYTATNKKPEVKVKYVKQTVVKYKYVKQPTLIHHIDIDLLSDWIFKNSFRCSKIQALEYAKILTKYRYSLILASIVKNESSFNVTAYSKSGAIGLMQILPSQRHIKQLEENGIIKNTRDLFDPEVNVKAGNFILMDVLKINKGDITKALRMYSGSNSYSKRVFETLGELTLYCKQ